MGATLRRCFVPDTVREEITVRADPATVLGVIAEVAAYPRWQDDVRDVQILESDDAGRPVRARLVVDAGAFRATMVLRYVHTPTSMSWSLEEGDTLRRNDGIYELHDLGDGTTRVRYDLAVEPSVPVPGMLRRIASKRIVDGALRSLKQHVEAAR